MSNSDEPSLTPQGVKAISNFGCAKLPPIVRTRNVEAGEDIFPYKVLNFGRGNSGGSLSFNPLSEVIHRDKEVFALSGGLGEGSKDVHVLCSKW